MEGHKINPPGLPPSANKMGKYELISIFDALVHTLVTDLLLPSTSFRFHEESWVENVLNVLVTFDLWWKHV